MLVKILSLTTMLLSGQALAQGYLETSGLNSSRALEYLKTHFSASYHGEIYGVRRDATSEDEEVRKVKDFKIMHNPTIVYKPTEDWQFLSTAEFAFSDQPAKIAGADYPNGFYRALFTLTRKNILVEKDHGVQLNIGVGRRQFNTGADQRPGEKFALASNGNNRAFANLSKTIGNTSASLFAQYLHNDYKVQKQTTWAHSAEFIPSVNIQITDKLSYYFSDDIIFNTAKSDETDSELSMTHEMNVAYITYQWNDKISTYYQLKYIHNEGFSREFQHETDYMSHYTGLTYAFTPKQSVTFEIGSELAHSRDGRDVFSKNVAYPEVALYVDLAI
jgi:hypothetical protein